LALGFWAAYVSSFCPNWWSWMQKVSPYLAACAGAMLAVIACLPALWMYRVGLTVLAVGFTALLVWLMNKPWQMGTGWSVIKAVALCSYSVYLTHALMLHAARSVLKTMPVLPWFSYFPIALGLIAIAGTLSYLLVERPSIILRDRWIARRTGVVIDNPAVPGTEEKPAAKPAQPGDGKESK